VVEYAEVLAAYADGTWGSVTPPCLMSRCWRHNTSVLLLAVVLHNPRSLWLVHCWIAGTSRGACAMLASCAVIYT
jgi:hypothetical protein